MSRHIPPERVESYLWNHAVAYLTKKAGKFHLLELNTLKQVSGQSLLGRLFAGSAFRRGMYLVTIHDEGFTYVGYRTGIATHNSLLEYFNKEHSELLNDVQDPIRAAWINTANRSLSRVQIYDILNSLGAWD